MQPTIAYLTAGGAGMYCGSCMHDNTLARAMARRGVNLLLTPMYTPIRTDEENVSIDRVFFGGINVYLQQKLPLFRRLPEFVDRFFDQPWLLKWATSHGIETSPQQLGAMTLSMLQGAGGFQRKEVRKLCRWLADEVRPDLVILSNMLIAGAAPTLKEMLPAPLLVTLQGDDIFLDDLPEPYKKQAFAEIRRLAGSVDGYLVHSRFYADHMAEYFGIDREAIHLVPLGIDTHDFGDGDAAGDVPAVGSNPDTNHRPPTVGYLARLAPEKGLHVMVDAFLELRRRPGMEHARLHLAGWLGEPQRPYAEEQFQKLREAGLGDAFYYAGAVDRRRKIDFLRGLDVFSVPTTYRDPKGLFYLEALAAGVPVVAPAHGAFPELLSQTGGGRLIPPGDPLRLADALHELLLDPQERRRLGSEGRRNVHARFHADAMAQNTLDCLRSFLPPSPAGAAATLAREISLKPALLKNAGRAGSAEESQRADGAGCNRRT
jgi:glycosyltransferase involved in cell wall biosynthesis